MGVAESDQQPRTRADNGKKADAGKYVVLRMTTLQDQQGGDVLAWMETGDGTVKANGPRKAIEKAAVVGGEVQEGEYVAVPLLHFKPKPVKGIVEPRISIG